MIRRHLNSEIQSLGSLKISDFMSFCFLWFDVCNVRTKLEQSLKKIWILWRVRKLSLRMEIFSAVKKYSESFTLNESWRGDEGSFIECVFKVKDLLSGPRFSKCILSVTSFRF